MTEETLTPLQMEVLDALLAGKSRKQIAQDRRVSPTAIWHTVRKIRRSLGVANDIELGAWAERNKLMPERA